MRVCTGSSARVCHHERKAMRGERVFQLAWHHGGTANCVRWVTGTEFFICENECAASLEKQDTRLQTCIQVKALKDWMCAPLPIFIVSSINQSISINVYAKCV